ncbi:UV-B-induced protein At3g17800, chloroplastic-like isoform X2 [Ananas comosus]|uniref:UV-B-induced protein At3g17800, chloroplastic-like isoform X2 n=1 Tax=Ananas comosus TaxID=4615 RepID=A0A6P5EVR3_ANACO|nr:UV-B-induced protein At3g17800, chloroplastic-like isoform X2 [Ananas comosus]XP_020085363.1 UV-B-induced protein At3g17800, chloroplastic-like isoform X2 [Ananas comosus]
MLMCGVAAEGPLVLPCPSNSGAGFRSPPVDFRALPTTKAFAFTGYPRIGLNTQNCPVRSFKVRALEVSGEGQMPIAPLQFESPTGQLLSQIMQSHPHLLQATIDQQLERLQSDRDSQKDEASLSPQDLLLYRRIAEVKDKERKRALEEIIYCFIVQKFIENDISMIPTISSNSHPASQIDSWPNQEEKLEKVHSPHALEMIQSHLTLILGERIVGPLNTIVHISKLKLGKLYAASIMYGYFLKRVDERYQLERTMKTLPKSRTEKKSILDDMKPNPFWDLESMVQISPSDEDDDDGSDGGDEESNKSYRLRSYVMYLDAETLQRYATIRSKEAISLIEKQTQALFGRPDIRVADDGSIDAKNDEMVAVTFSGLTMLVLEAVAFGSFLWVAEGYVESKYHFFNS